MTSPRVHEPPTSSRLRARRFLCHRRGARVGVEEVRQCPYYFGRLDPISRHHLRFCDFDPDLDPHSFGFPSFSRRWNS